MLFEHALDAILLADDEGRYLDANPAACALLGRTREQILAADVFDVTPVPDRETGRRLWRAFIEGGKQEGEYALCRPDGSCLTIEYRAVANIEPGVHLSVLRDVSDRNRAEIDRQRFVSLAQSSTDFIGMSTPDGRPIFVNPAGLTMMGFATLEQALATPVIEYFWPDDRQRILNEGIPALRRDGRWMGPCRFRHAKTGEPIDTVWNAFVIRDPTTHEPVAWATISPDLRHAKRAAQAVAEARDAAEDANRAKDRFLAVLSHELRTPLSPVLMAATAMETDPDLPAQFRDDLTMIRRNIELETKLIDDLLDLSRVTSGKLRLNLEPQGLHEILRQVLRICDGDLRDKRLNVIERLDAKRDRANVDAARLQQVFWNLVRNATKFTPAGGDVTVRTWNDDAGHVCVDVTDSGIGIAPERLPRIFDAFEQGDAGITRQFGGLGLGLAIAKAVVEMHGGAIGVASDGAGKGTTFTVRLNVAAARPVSGDVTEPSPAAAKTDGIPRLLLVDDHPDTARTLARLLTRSGYEVRTADSVAAALKLAADESFDLVVSDIGLPDGTGYELMQEARARHGLSGIALSGYGMEEDMRRSKDVGFVEHVVKPVNMTHLEQVIRRAIGAGG